MAHRVSSLQECCRWISYAVNAMAQCTDRAYIDAVEDLSKSQLSWTLSTSFSGIGGPEQLQNLLGYRKKYNVDGKTLVSYMLGQSSEGGCWMDADMFDTIIKHSGVMMLDGPGPLLGDRKSTFVSSVELLGLQGFAIADIMKVYATEHQPQVTTWDHFIPREKIVIGGQAGNGMSLPVIGVALLHARLNTQWRLRSSSKFQRSSLLDMVFNHESNKPKV